MILRKDNVSSNWKVRDGMYNPELLGVLDTQYIILHMKKSPIVKCTPKC